MSHSIQSHCGHSAVFARCRARARGVAFAASLACFLAASAAPAHHILGIPHYKYSEEYPQIPLAEVLAQTPTADVYFTYMPGTPRPGQEVRIKIYAKRRADGSPIVQPMKVEVLRKSFGGETPIMDPFEIETGVGPEANDYKFFLKFARAEAYVTRVHFPDDGAIEVIDFPITIGETDDRPLIGGAFVMLALTGGIVAVVKRRRRKRRPKKKGAR